MDAINSRRSIRRFSDREIPHDIICKIIESGIKAPSSKNRQPWKFMVIQGQAKEEMLRAFRAGIQREKSGRAMLPESSCSSWCTCIKKSLPAPVSPLWERLPPHIRAALAS